MGIVVSLKSRTFHRLTVRQQPTLRRYTIIMSLNSITWGWVVLDTNHLSGGLNQRSTSHNRWFVSCYSTQLDKNAQFKSKSLSRAIVFEHQTPSLQHMCNVQPPNSQPPMEDITRKQRCFASEWVVWNPHFCSRTLVFRFLLTNEKPDIKIITISCFMSKGFKYPCQGVNWIYLADLTLL